MITETIKTMKAILVEKLYVTLYSSWTFPLSASKLSWFCNLFIAFVSLRRRTQCFVKTMIAVDKTSNARVEVAIRIA